MTEKQILEVIADVESGGTHWDKYSLLLIIKQLKDERDKLQDHVNSLMGALDYGQRP